ncbi:MAG: putative baseplate assembly protein, partial [Bryobacteraceae bacterium]
MIQNAPAPSDTRDLPEIASEVLARHAGYVPEWIPADKTAGNGLAWIFARFLQVVVQRLNQAPEKNRLAFFDLLGMGLVPAQSARAPLAFKITPGAADSNAPAATQVAAPPPPGSSDQIVFETEQAAGVMAANLAQVVSLWPGRDEYLDHSAALAANTPVTLFDHLRLQPTQHTLYLAHNTLLALTGSVEIDVEFELTQTSPNPLQLRWEYWDGQVWRGFKGMNPACAGVIEPTLDSTLGLTRSGTFRLQAGCAMAAQTSVNGIQAFWIRGSLTDTLPADPAIVLPQVDRIRLSSFIQQTLNDDDPGNPQSGILPDNALSGATKLDLTKAFYPFDHQPQPGDAFYFSSEEIFAKPGAHVSIAIAKSDTPLEQVTASSTTPLAHEVAWEYWNGTDWVGLAVLDGKKPPADFTGNGLIQFTVPKDMVKTAVN